MFLRISVILNVLVALSRWQFVDAQGNIVVPGDACRNGGTCKRGRECPHMMKLLKRDRHSVEICGLDSVEYTIVVCCEPRNKTSSYGPLGTRVDGGSQNPKPNLRVSEKKCNEYSKYVYVEEPSLSLAGISSSKTNKVDHCANPAQGLINGGMPARPKEFPHMVEIGYGRPPEDSYQCGGSLISERWVLSAAHCSDLPDNIGRPRFARLGELDSNDDDDGARPQIVKIVEIVNHPNYVKSQMYNDIALYRLAQDIVLSPYIRPICLHVRNQIGYNYGTAIGFGHIHFGGNYFNYLQKVDLNFEKGTTCFKKYGKTEKLPRGINETTMLCAGDEEGKDTCQGDSGGSLFVNSMGRYCMHSQVGITSFGRPCGGGFPGVYTRVSHYVPWIEKTVWPEEFD